MKRIALLTFGAVDIAAHLAPLPDGAELIVAEKPGDLADPGTIDALLVMPPVLTAELVGAMPRLAWLQTLTAGIDALAPLGVPDRVLLSTARGVVAPHVAELAMLHMLALSTDLRGHLADAAERRWRPRPRRPLQGSRVVMVGVGAIAEELARRCEAFGMDTVGVSDGRTEVECFDRIVPRAELVEVAAGADFLVVLAAHDATTDGLIDAQVLAALPPHAFLINVSRGRVVDEEALIAALVSRSIAGAGLDVTATEPLPADSPLWRLNNVLITPHIGGWTTRFAAQIAPLLDENIRRWMAGKPLLNRVCD